MIGDRDWVPCGYVMGRGTTHYYCPFAPIHPIHRGSRAYSEAHNYVPRVSEPEKRVP